MGSYGNILITVSDGQLSRSLASFSIVVSQPLPLGGTSVATGATGGTGTALVSWSAPLINADGSMLTDLTGFNIYYGQDPAMLDHVYQLDCGWCLWHVMDNLGPGTWYFAVKAYNRYGIESNLSPLASKTIL